MKVKFSDSSSTSLMHPISYHQQLLIEKETGLPCKCRSEIAIPPREKHGLVLYDCFSVDYARLWIRLEFLLDGQRDNIYLAFFNVDPDAALEKDAVARGINRKIKVKSRLEAILWVTRYL